MNLSMILAMDNNNLIGNKNQLPWSLPADLKHFKSITTGKIIVMGRLTFESIGRPLPNRLNVVITTDKSFSCDGVLVFNNIDSFIEFSQKQDEEVIVIGGANLIKQLYLKISKIYITHIKHAFEGDCFVDFIDFKKIKILSEKKFKPDDKNLYYYSFCEYEKTL